MRGKYVNIELDATNRGALENFTKTGTQCKKLVNRENFSLNSTNRTDSLR